MAFFNIIRENDIKTYLEQIYNGIVEKDIVTERSKINKEKFVTITIYDTMDLQLARKLCISFLNGLIAT